MINARYNWLTVLSLGVGVGGRKVKVAPNAGKSSLVVLITMSR